MRLRAHRMHTWSCSCESLLPPDAAAREAAGDGGGGGADDGALLVGFDAAASSASSTWSRLCCRCRDSLRRNSSDDAGLDAASFGKASGTASRFVLLEAAGAFSMSALAAAAALLISAAEANAEFLLGCCHGCFGHESGCVSFEPGAGDIGRRAVLEVASAATFTEFLRRR